MKKIVSLILLLASWHCQAQDFPNGGFEGIRTENVAPAPWVPCGVESTPDTQPGSWKVSMPPYNGQSYLGLVARGPEAEYPNSSESTAIALFEPLKPGECFQYSIALATADKMRHFTEEGEVAYQHPTKLQIWGGTLPCEFEELLWESPVIAHPDWQQYYFSVNAQKSELKHFILKAVSAGSPGFGNLLVDDFRYIEQFQPILRMDTTVVYGSEISLDLPEGFAYHWSDTDGLDCTSCPNPTLTVTKESTYKVIIERPGFCHYEEHFNIGLEIGRPDAFSPNRDGINDFFNIPNLPSDLQLRIVNRWGELVYFSDDYQGNWDGKSLATGVYYYEFSSPNLRRSIKGPINIVR